MGVQRKHVERMAQTTSPDKCSTANNIYQCNLKCDDTLSPNNKD